MQDETEDQVRVLLVEGDLSMSKNIELNLINSRFIVYSTDLGREGIELAKITDYDILLLDIDLPDMNGFEVLRQLRAAKVNVPIFIISRSDRAEDKVKGLGLGADDYLTKPFHQEELIARIRAVVRRSKGHLELIIQTGELVVNVNNKTVEMSGNSIILTCKEYQVLELLALRKGATLTKGILLSHLYRSTEMRHASIIDVYVCKLRKKMSEYWAGQSYIETVWGLGYALREPVEFINKFPSSLDRMKRP